MPKLPLVCLLALVASAAAFRSSSLSRHLGAPVALLPPPPPPTTTGLHSSLIGGGDQYGLWAVAAAAASAGLQLEKRTAVGRSLSGPVCAMLITVVLTNVGVLPAAGSVHLTNLQGFVVRLATPLLLLGADMRLIFRETRGLLKVFSLGTLSTIVGSTLGFAMVGRNLRVLSDDGWKVSAALTAKNIGGGLNYMAVCSALGISPSTVALGLSVDNLLGLLYFPFISWLAYPYEEKGSFLLKGQEVVAVGEEGQEGLQRQGQEEVGRLATVLAVGLAVVGVSEHLGRMLGFSPVVVSTVLTVLVATLLPQHTRDLVPAGDLLGKLLLLLFFGSIGNSSGTVAATLSTKGVSSLLAFDIILYAGHLVILLGVGRFLKIPMPDLLIASNANIGNAATASSLAVSKGWKSLLLPSLLVGTFGNSVGTFIGLIITRLFKRLA